jgi:hypothetical protein
MKKFKFFCSISVLMQNMNVIKTYGQSHKKISSMPLQLSFISRNTHTKKQNMMLPPGTFGKEKSSPAAFGVFQVSYGRAFTTFLAPNHFSLVGD